MNRYFSITRFLAIIIKEFIQMRRDRVTFSMMVGIPLIQLVLFGFAGGSASPSHACDHALVATCGDRLQHAAARCNMRQQIATCSAAGTRWRICDG